MAGLTRWSAGRTCPSRGHILWLVSVRSSGLAGRENLPLVRYSLKPYLRKNPGAER